MYQGVSICLNGVEVSQAYSTFARGTNFGCTSLSMLPPELVPKVLIMFIYPSGFVSFSFYFLLCFLSFAFSLLASFLSRAHSSLAIGSLALPF